MRSSRMTAAASALPPSGSSDEDPYSLTPSGSSGSSGGKGGKNGATASQGGKGKSKERGRDRSAKDSGTHIFFRNNN